MRACREALRRLRDPNVHALVGVLVLGACAPRAYPGPDGGGLDAAARLDGGGDAASPDRAPAPDRTWGGWDLGLTDHAAPVPDATGRDLRIIVTDSGLPPADAGGGVCEQPRKRLDRDRLFVVNGTRQPTYLTSLTAGQRLAAVGLATPWDGSFCSGTLIAPRVVLTAEHCHADQAGLSNIRVQFSSDGIQLVRELGVTAFHRHASLDVGVYILGVDATTQLAVTPVPILPTDLDSSWVGSRVEAAGWGTTSPGGTTDGRYWVAEPIYQVTSTDVVVNGEGLHGVCWGDSGGPILGLVGGEARTLGSLSWGDSSCTGLDHFIRADVVRTWVEQYTGTTPPLAGTGGCGSTTGTGRCESSNTVAVYCDGDQLRQDNCAAQSLVCGWSSTAGGYRCVEQVVDPCQGLTAIGQCQGSTVVWCASGQLRSFDCAQCGWDCAYIDSSVGYDCDEDSSAGGCQIPPTGQCNGDTLEYCDEHGQMQSIPCWAYGYHCIFDTYYGIYGCG